MPTAPINEQVSLVQGTDGSFPRLTKVLLFYIDANLTDLQAQTLQIYPYRRDFDKKLRLLLAAKRAEVLLYFEYLAFENQTQLLENLLNLAKFETNCRLSRRTILDLNNLHFIENFYFKARISQKRKPILTGVHIDALATIRHSKTFSLVIGGNNFRHATLAEQLTELQRKVAVEARAV